MRYGHFSVENAHFLPFPFNPQFENVPLALDRWNFARLNLTYMANNSYERFSLRPNV